ncbi:NAD-dependent epimerase/dehydratase family protein [Zavarzinia sp. CC-PAN008]|uniref:NAD-dependent epimerase/dehydratase family protein n=1 Tax=Zavarzinia sp. CC-PAN008 TaxID=3243332 RepID=UPI003F743457
MSRKTVLIAGASGLVGYAAMKHFAQMPDCSVIAVSRRAPDETYGARFIAADLTDEAACAALFSTMPEVTHVVFASLFEKPGLAAGWLEADQIETNGRMLRNLFEPLARVARGLRHVTLLQGTKAYGAHVRQIDVPARPNRSEAKDVPNFYWVQEDYLREKQKALGFRLAIFRPQIIFGFSWGSAMNLIPAIGAYAALRREAGLDLAFPGGNPMILEAVDADLLARAIAWATDHQPHEIDTYNVTNGDVFVWHNLWPAIADALGMKVGQPERQALGPAVAQNSAAWDRIRTRFSLVAPPLAPFVGESMHYADFTMGYYMEGSQGLAPIVSTINLRQDGFAEVMDTADMFRKWFRIFQDKRLLPPR